MAHILRLGQKHIHRIAVPVIGPGHILAVLEQTDATAGQIIAGGLHSLIGQNLCDLITAVALNAELEDPPHHGSRFFVNDPVVFIVRVFLITINGMGGSVFTGVSLDLIGGRYLPGLIPEVPLVHDIQERGELTAVLILAVHAIGNGNKMNPMLPEEYLGIKAGLQIVTSCTAHILYDHTADLTGFNVSNHALPIRSLKIAA